MKFLFTSKSYPVFLSIGLYGLWARWDLSLIVSLCALYVAVYEMQRNNVPLVRVMKSQCSSCSSVSENNGNSFGQFEIVTRNMGVKLIDAIVKLEFVETDGCGRISIQLAEFREIRGTHGEFERNMIAAFGWKSYTFDPFVAPMFLRLSDPGKQRAAFRIYSQSYIAYELRIGGWLDRLKNRWNGIAVQVHGRFRRTIKAKDGLDRAYVPEWLPTLITFESHVMEFVKLLERPDSSTAMPGAP